MTRALAAGDAVVVFSTGERAEVLRTVAPAPGSFGVGTDVLIRTADGAEAWVDAGDVELVEEAS